MNSFSSYRTVSTRCNYVGTPLTPPKIAYCTKSFFTLRQRSDIIVDKSLLIKELVETDKKIIVITRPRRFGKSVNLDMVRRFFELELDKNGVPVLSQHKRNTPYFVGGEVSLPGNEKKLLRKLDIANHPDVISKYHGQFPIAYINLCNIEPKEEESIEFFVREKVFHDNLVHYRGVAADQLEAKISADSDLNDAQKKRLAKYLLQEHENRLYEVQEVEDSLRFLIEVLHYKNGKRKVFVLVDEYHVPVEEAYYEFGEQSSNYTSLVLMLRNMFTKAFDRNPYIEKVVITGIARFSNGNLLADLNEETEHATLFDEAFSTYYGFTQNEVDHLLKQIPTRHNPNALKSFHQGYNYGTVHNVVYNMWSFVSYFNDPNSHPLKNYWSRSGRIIPMDIEEILPHESMQNELYVLLQGKHLTKDVYRQASMGSARRCENSLYSFLVMGGYLNPIPVRKGENETFHLFLPNRDAGELITKSVIEWIEKKLHTVEYYSILEFLHKGLIDTFRQKLEEQLEAMVSSVDEKDYDTLMKSSFILFSWGYEYIMWSGVDYGDNTFYYTLVPKTHSNRNAFIIKCVVVKGETDLSSVAKSGLNKINDMPYTDIIKERLKGQIHVQKLFKVCLVLCVDKVAIEYQVVNAVHEK